MSTETNEPNFLYGRWLASPPPGEEVVISGMSGRLPESNNVYEYRDNLFNKKEMVTPDDGRWKLDHPEIPDRTAKIYNIDKYDAGYFGVHYRQANIMDPMMRKLMETAIEAIMDAGINPAELEGSNTGVFVSTTWSDMENDTLMNITEPQKFGATGFFRSLIAHRLSYYLKLKGPSTTIDTACSSSLNALNLAFKYIRGGQCDKALVGCANLLIHPGNSIQFYRLRVCNKDGICKVFDQDADGYARGETIACIFLQKAKDSRRIYAQIVNIKVNDDGFKEQGITYPSTQAQQALMSEIYEESGIDVDELSFLEAHGTGTQVGDPQEVEAIDFALAKKRTKPLLVGSVKSNIGHTEPSSGICSLIKVLLAMETGLIAPNMNLRRIKKGMKGFEEGRLIPVTELTPLEGEEALVGINNFGFGGNNCHAMLRRYKKKKIDYGLPKDDIPRLVCVSGRSEEAVDKLVQYVNNKTLDAEYISLVHQMFKNDIQGHIYRGYTIVSKVGPIETSVRLFDHKSEFYVFFGKLERNQNDLGTYLLNFPVFKNTISQIDNTLMEKNVKCFENLIDCNQTEQERLLAGVCIQLGLVDVLKKLELNPVVVGENYGKFSAAYYYDTLNLNEILQSVLKNINIEPDESFTSAFEFHRFSKDIKSDGFNIKNLETIPEDSFLLNVSDSRLNNKDVLLVENNNIVVLNIFGRLYQQGHNPQLYNLYPKVQYPVSRETPMISPLIQWNHDKSWYTYKFSDFKFTDANRRAFKVSYSYDEYRFISGHIVDGRNLFPATEYLHLVWQTFAQSRRISENKLPVIFTDCKFIRAVTMPKNGFINLLVTIQKGSGNFEILEKDSTVVSGRIEFSSDVDQQQCDFGSFDLKDDRSEILEQDEIYREMYLRGYNYSGVFKGIKKCNIDASAGLITWENNWGCFMDKMLQMKILQTDTRLLYVPVGIKKLTINPIKHLEMAQNLQGEEILFPVQVHEKANIVKSGGIEIRGLLPKSISRRKQRLEPVLEKNVFVPNYSSAELADAVRINTQLILENSLETQFKAVEVIDENTVPDSEILMFLVCKALDDVPVVVPDLTVSTKNNIEEKPGVKIESVALTPESNCLLIVATNLLQRLNSLRQILGSLVKSGYILTREDIDFEPDEKYQDIDILTIFKTPNEKLILLRKSQLPVETTFIKVSSKDFQWLPNLQKQLANESNVVIYCNNEETEGVLGLINCLRREPKGHKVKCFFIMDRAPEFNPENEFYKNQLQKNLAINVYKNKSWGTYRHLLLKKLDEIECLHSFVNVTTRGDLSTLKWLEGSLDYDTELGKDQVLISVYYAAINFKDIMTASGRVNIENFTTNRLEQECPVGFEICGRDLSGRRYAGMITSKAIASLAIANTKSLWELPENWSLEDAATVPVVYSTVIYSLLMIANMKPGDSILIHSATGGVGLAALNVCTYYKCKIFVTVGTQEKRDYLKKHYPEIPDSHISSSRDTNFEEMIKAKTNNRGVDIVLNSLSEDKLKASVRCLAYGGRFMEIGKFDLGNDAHLELLFMEKCASYHGIMLDKIFGETEETKVKIIDLVKMGMRKGFVKPLPRVVFEKEEVEKAYRYMMTGKHIGKVVIKVQDEEKEKIIAPQKKLFKAHPRFNCDSRRSYVIVGGLGGVGLELADWLILRGAKKIILVSRAGIQSGYQKQRLRIWESYGIEVKISTKNITTREGCYDLIHEANKMAPVDAVFNLAVVLKDALFEDQTEESFRASLAPKAEATKHLDQVTRELCPHLRHFVIFSSVSCGRGNAGQTNYGMANSIMERICEKRKEDGLPAVAIQWGAIGEVGLVAKMQKENKELVIGGTLQQRISSCLEVLDKLLKHQDPIVSSMVVAKKHSKNFGQLSATEAVALVLGIEDLKTVSQHSTLAELGMDSMMGTEVIQLLEKDFDIYITAKDARSLTFAKLTEMENEKKENVEEKTYKAQKGTDVLIQHVPDNTKSHLPVIRLPSSVSENEKAKAVFILTGVEGVFTPLEVLCKQLKAHIFGIQYNYQNPEDFVEETARNLLPHFEANVSKDQPFTFIGYSFGSVVILEIVSILEAKGYRGDIILLDGSPTYITSSVKENFPYQNENAFETALICKILSILVPADALKPYEEKILNCKDLNERMKLARSLLPQNVTDTQKLEEQAAVCLYKRLKALTKYTFNHEKIKSEVYLFKAKYPIVSDAEDYHLSEICEKKVNVFTVDGDHVKMLSQPELAKNVSEIIGS